MAELPDPFAFGRCALHVGRRQLLVDGQAVPVGGRAFDLLVALVERRDRVVSKNELFDVVWPGLVVEENNLQVQIFALRKLLGAPAIATVPGRGYRFTAADVSASTGALTTPAVVPAVTAPPPRNDSARLLVADDNKVNRLLLARSLQLLGHQVTSVENGRAALDCLRREPIDLVLLDLEMPEMDGFALLEQLAADVALRDVPVIVTSSLEGVVHVARCIELGAEDYLRKPVNPVLLKARVGSSLEKKRLRDRQRALLQRFGHRPGAAPSGTDMNGREAAASILALRLAAPPAPAGTQSADETIALLNEWSTLAFEAIGSAGGQVLQAGGDGVLALFDATAFESASAAAQAAVQAGRELGEMLAQFNAERVEMGRAAVTTRAGIASGTLVIGVLDTPAGRVCVGIGAPMQEAAWLATQAADGGRLVLCDAATASLAGQPPPDERVGGSAGRRG